MMHNYLGTAWRNLWRSKVYSGLTIAGLGLGLAVSLLSILYVADELSFDHYNLKARQIYRVNSDLSFSGKPTKSATSPTPMGETMKKDFPEVVQATRLGKYGTAIVRSLKATLVERDILYADSTFFDVFTLPMLAGNPSTALADPQAVVLSERAAITYFGTTDVLNKTLVFDKEVRRVTGIVAKIPVQSHFQADFFLPLHESKDARMNKWGNHIFYTYVLLRPEADPARVEAKFEQILKTYIDPALQRFFSTTLTQLRKDGGDLKYTLMPVTDIHLYSDREGEIMPNGSISYVYLFGIIALFILMIAVFNFINLTTARATRRAQAVGIRKVLGSGRLDLLFRFLAESLLNTFLALLVAIGLLYVFMPSFNDLSAKSISASQILDFPFILYLLPATALTGILAGLYPAFYLSSFKVTSALKGQLSTLPKRQNLRSYLVVFQFASSILLIIGTMVIREQMKYIQTKKVGFDKEQVIIVKTSQSTDAELLTFKNEVLKNPAVQSGSVSSYLPVKSRRSDDSWFPDSETDQKTAVRMQEWKVDPDYVATMGMTMLHGRNFRKEMPSDQQAVIINESAAKQYGYGNPVGKVIHKRGDEKLTIIGVVADFHFESLRNTIGPVGLILDGALVGGNAVAMSSEAVSFRLAPAKAVSTAIKNIGKSWKQLAPGRPFEYAFLNDDFDAMYRSEQRIEKLFAAFATVAIWIACLGLFGLSAYSAEQRQKEIGVRKVLGASLASVVTLLSADFLKLILIALIIACPLAWFGMQKWLQGFTYRTEIGWGIFLLAGLLATGVALLTISFQSVKAALMNPVESLKSE